MTSNHFAMTYAHPYNWAILIAISLAGALIRIYFVARHKGRASPVPLIVAAIVLLATAIAIAPRAGGTSNATATIADIRPVIMERCTTCHSATPTHIAFAAAPSGVILDNDNQIIAEADRIHQQTFVLKIMPIGNLTQMSEDERGLIDAWYQALNRGD
jgi:uncharacterized membrane protein